MAASIKQFKSAIRLVTAQTRPQNCDTHTALQNRLYESRDAVHAQQHRVERGDLKSKVLVAGFARYK